MSDIEQYYSVEEIAEKLSITALNVRRLLKNGELKGIKIGRLWRVSESNLKEFLEGRK